MRKILAINILFFLICSACNDFDASQIKNINEGKVLRIGHAGSGFHSWIPFNPLPSNSYKSVITALKSPNSDGVEVDVQMSADSVFVLYHDKELDTKTNLSGCIPQLEWSELQKADYQLGWPFDWFHQEKLMRLSTLLKEAKNQHDFPHLHFDLRTFTKCFDSEANRRFGERFIQQLNRQLLDFEIPKQKVLLITTDKGVIETAKSKDVSFPIAYEITTQFKESLQWADKQQIKYVVVKSKLLSTVRTKKAHDLGIKVITFYAKSKSGNSKLLMLNPDMVQTDNLNALNELLTN